MPGPAPRRPEAGSGADDASIACRIIGRYPPLPSRKMHLRVVLRAPGGDSVTLDTQDERWAQPWGEPDEVISGNLWALPGLVDGHAHLAQERMDFRPGDLEGAERRTAL